MKTGLPRNVLAMALVLSGSACADYPILEQYDPESDTRVTAMAGNVIGEPDGDSRLVVNAARVEHGGSTQYRLYVILSGANSHPPDWLRLYVDGELVELGSGRGARLRQYCNGECVRFYLNQYEITATQLWTLADAKEVELTLSGAEPLTGFTTHRLDSSNITYLKRFCSKVVPGQEGA
jgi:hypothetical protein